MYNLPNLLTISRIVVIPVIFLSIYFHSFFWTMLTGILFVAASITDYLDGYLARARNETSAFGRLLDPIADKLLVATALVVILAKPDMYSCKLTILPVFVILCREILVSGLREFLREVNVGLPVTKLAKWKTAFQMVALSMMLFKDLWIGWSYMGELLLWVAATLTFITGYQYYQKSLEYVKAEEAKKINPARKIKQPEKVEEVVAEPILKTTVKAKSTKSTAKTTKAKSRAKTATSKVRKTATKA